jgi:DNA-binding NtrC family response regulator
VHLLLERIVSERRAGTQHNLPVLMPDTLAALRKHSWPGNLRELSNALTHALIYAESGEVCPKHLPEEILNSVGSTDDHGHEPDRVEVVRRYVASGSEAEERRLIIEALRMTAGNRTHAARKLGMSRQTLWIKVRRYRLEEDE